MPDRYTLFEIEKLRDRFHLPQGVPSGVKRSYNISPTQSSPVIVNRAGARELTQMKWGFIRSHAKDANGVFRYKTHIAKSEGIFTKPTWGEAIRHSRCLIPANGFYEWQATSDGKRPFYIRPKDQDVFAFAGICSSWTDPEGVEWGTYSIVTTVPNKEMGTINKRMPVILHSEDEATWLDPAVDDVSTLYKIMRPYDDEMLQIKMVTPDVKSTKINDPRLIVPLVTH